MSTVRTGEEIKDVVRQAYGDIARQFVETPTRAGCCGPADASKKSAVQSGCCGPAEVPEKSTNRSSCCGPAEMPEERVARSSCCGSVEENVVATGATRFYAAEELAGLPDTVTEASLGCGNPLAIAGLRPGEVVLDLGSGGGIDCFLAARAVGPEGRVIGLDMTPDMIKLARRNAKKMGVTNVDFRFGEMEEMPLPDESVDVIISNCVINLSPDKDAVFREAHRVLRPGGRLSVSDIVVDGQLPQVIRENLNAWAGCIAGALDESDYLGKVRAAGFEQVEVLSREYADLDEATEWDDVAAMVVGEDGRAVGGDEAQVLLAGAGLSPRDLARKVASVKVRAYKPA
jgi:arsenite methyltransferase